MNNDKAQRYTFRTEMQADNERVPALLEALGFGLLDSREISDPVLPEYKMGVFTFSSVRDLEDIRVILEREIESNAEFVDMHRCYQTLAIGDEPDEF